MSFPIRGNKSAIGPLSSIRPQSPDLAKSLPWIYDFTEASGLEPDGLTSSESMYQVESNHGAVPPDKDFYGPQATRLAANEPDRSSTACEFCGIPFKKRTGEPIAITVMTICSSQYPEDSQGPTCVSAIPVGRIGPD